MYWYRGEVVFMHVPFPEKSSSRERFAFFSLFVSSASLIMAEGNCLVVHRSSFLGLSIVAVAKFLLTAGGRTCSTGAAKGVLQQSVALMGRAIAKCVLAFYSIKN